MRSFIFSGRVLQWLQFVSLALVIGIMLMLFGLADSQLATSTLSLNPPWDKLLHIVVYAAIAFLLQFSGTLQSAWLVWCLPMGVGLLDEFQQIHIPGREANPLDLMADAIGVTLGVLLMRYLSRFITVKA